MTRQIHNRFPLNKIAFLLLFALCLPGLAEDKPVEIGTRSTRRIHCMGQSWKVPVYSTSDPEVVMIRADQSALDQVSRALGKHLHWSESDGKLKGEGGSSVTVGQREVTVNGEATELQPAPRVIEGKVYIPSSALEGLMPCRVTVKQGSTGAIYVEPILQSMSFEDGKPTSTEFVARTSVPVRKKVFTLNRPERTVVDLVGVALPKNLEKIDHPVLGEIRVGQFQLAPSITRIVIPTGRGIKVNTKRTLDLFEHQMSIRWPQGTVAQDSSEPERVPTIVIKPTRMPDRTEPVVVPDPPSVPERPSPPEVVTVVKSGRPELSEVAWDNDRLKLTFTEPVEYRWSRVRAGQDRYVIDFPNVIFPQKRQNLSSAVPGLQGVRVVQNMPEPQPVVRLVCDLRAPIVVEASGVNERQLYLKFPGRRMSAVDMPRGMGYTSQKLAASGSAGGKTICIDAGHGGSDPGAINHSVGVDEKRVTLDIALKLGSYLKAQGWNVILTRTTDRDVSWANSSAKQELGARSDFANQRNVDLFVSIHANASVNPDINGTSIHWYKSSDYRLASLLEDGVMNGTGRKNRGLVKNRFYVLAHTDMPAVLIETAFLTNPTEGKLLADPAYRDKIARGIASGLQVYASRTFVGTAAQK